jgi:outer membrane protein assembly factor BamB
MRNFVIMPFILLLFLNQVNAQPGAQWRGPERNGKYPDAGLMKTWPEEGPELLFSTSDIGKGYSSAVFDNGVYYVTGMKDTLDYLTAIDGDGHIKWQVPYGLSWEDSFPDTRSTPAVEGDRIYVISGMGELACVNTSGEIVWKVDVDGEFAAKLHIWGVSESPLIVDDMVLCTPVGEKASMVALNKYDGSLIWSANPVRGRRSYASPILYEYNDISLILAMSTTDLFAVDPENGNVEWSFHYSQLMLEDEDAEEEEEEEEMEEEEEEEEEELEEEGEDEEDAEEDEEEDEEEDPDFGLIFTNTPYFYKDEIFLTAGYDMTAAMLELAPDGKSVSLKYTDRTFDNHFHGMVLVDGYLYGSNWYNNSQGRWVCMKWSTGEIKYVDQWKTKGNILFADGLLYVYEERGTVGLVKPDKNGFDVISSFRISEGKGPHWAHLSIYDGKLLVRHGEVVMVYNIKDE